MTLFDYAVLTIISLSVLIGVVRGLVREILALAGWVVAFLVASMFSAELAGMLVNQIADESWRVLAAFASLFMATLIGMSILALIASRLIKSAGLGAEDRVFGSLFGFARGVAMVIVLVLLAGLTALPRQPVWKDAMLSPPLETLAAMVKHWLPQNWAKHIKY
jgi:membrane protein required for colicin V production